MLAVKPLCTKEKSATGLGLPLPFSDAGGRVETSRKAILRAPFERPAACVENVTRWRKARQCQGVTAPGMPLSYNRLTRQTGSL